MLTDELLDEARFAQQPLGHEPLDDGGHHRGRVAAPLEAPGKLRPAEVTASQQRERGGADRALVCLGRVGVRLPRPPHPGRLTLARRQQLDADRILDLAGGLGCCCR